MNKAFLVGRLTKDPELRYTGSNIAVANFTIAINRTFTNQSGEREADFINIIVWRKQAENIKNFLNKGSLVAIDGRISTRNYDDKDGNKRYVTEVVADNVQFLENKSQAQNRGQDNNAFDYKPTVDNSNNVNISTQEDPFADFGSSIEISDDDLPF